MGRISLDTETTGVDVRYGCLPFLVTTCDEDGVQRTWEWPVDPRTRTPRVPRGEAEEVRDLVERADRIVLQNSRFDAAALSKAGIVPDWPWDRTDDTLVAGHMLASAQPHDLTAMVLLYLGMDISKFDEALEEACVEARRVVRRRLPGWRIAREGLVEMPSAGGGSSRVHRGTESETPWKSDCWLPAALCRWAADREERVGPGWWSEYAAADHPWRAVVREYADADSSTTMYLWRAMEVEIDRKGFRRIYDVRMSVLRPVFEVEHQGVTVSVERLDRIEEEFASEADRIGRECMAIASSRGFDLVLPRSGRNKSLDEFVFEVLKLEPVMDPKSKTGRPCLDSKRAIPHYLETLRTGSDEIKFVELLSAKRKRDTAASYLRGYRRYLLPTDVPGWGRMHPTLNPTGTGTLRFSSSNPNGQSIGKQDVEGRGGPSVRDCFGPMPGREWWSLDYENIELRIPAYESGEEELIRLFERSDDPPYYGSEHLLNFSTVYPDIWKQELSAVGEAEVGKVIKKKYRDTWYRWCKFGGFAVGYGAIEREGGTADRAFRRPGSHARLRERFRRKEALNGRYIEMADRLGYVETLPDRTVDPSRGYPIACSRSEWGKISPTVPLNYHVQSTAMWCTMKAMIRCSDRLRGTDGYMVLQVHDEIVFDLPARGAGNLPVVEELRVLMERSGDDIGVPLRVSVAYHPVHWGREEPIPGVDKERPRRKPGSSRSIGLAAGVS